MNLYYSGLAETWTIIASRGFILGLLALAVLGCGMEGPVPQESKESPRPSTPPAAAAPVASRASGETPGVQSRNSSAARRAPPRPMQGNNARKRPANRRRNPIAGS